MAIRMVCLMGLAALLVSAQEREVGTGVNFYSIEKETALGKQLAGEFRLRTRPIENRSVLAYVDAIGQRLAKEMGGLPFPYSFELVADDATLMHEAASFPGGAVFVPGALILAARDEDEFAGMLARAVAHIASRHATKQATRAELVDIARTPVAYAGGWTGYALQQGADLAIPLGMLAMWRGMELEADRLAARKMAAAGWDPAALARYIERAQPADELTKPKTWQALPLRSARLTAIQAAIADLPAQAYGPHEKFAAIQEEVRRYMGR
jgi:predicted Zn-dependent protease